jgi:hypothetical protein
MPDVLEAPTPTISPAESPAKAVNTPSTTVTHDVRYQRRNWFAWLCGTTPVRDRREQRRLKDSAIDMLAREHPFLYSKALSG